MEIDVPLDLENVQLFTNKALLVFATNMSLPWIVP